MLVFPGGRRRPLGFVVDIGETAAPLVREPPFTSSVVRALRIATQRCADT